MSREVSSDLVGWSNQSGVLDTLKSRYRCVHEPPPAAATPHDRRYLTSLWVFEDREVDGPEAPLPPSFSYLIADQNIIDPHTIKEKITSVLKVLKFREPHVLVQIWSPTVLRKRRVLTTCDQPFGLGVADEGLLSYRLKSERSIIDVKVEHRDKLGSLGRVYRQKLPEWSLDVHGQDASDNIHGYINLPVFESSSDCCVGVLEIITSSHYVDFAFEVQEVSNALKSQNLMSPDAFGDRSFSIIDGRHHELDEEIYKVLKTTCDLHALPIAQVWAPSRYSSYVAISENLEQSCSSFNRSCIGKVCMSTDALPFYVRDLNLWDFHEGCRNRHLEKSQGVVGRSLSSCGTWFCEDVTKLDEDDYPLVHISRKSGLASCLAIYLKSLKEDLEHVIEFFLPVQSANETYVRRLMETVKQQINNSSWMQLDTISPPQVIGGLSFNWNFDSTTPSSVNLLTERGEVPPPESENMENELPNSAAGGARQSVVPYLENKIEGFHIKPVKISMKRKSSTRMISFEEISKHFGKSMDEAATILQVSRSTLKRTCRSLGISRWPYRKGPDMGDADTPMKSNKTDVAVHTSIGSFDAFFRSFKKSFRGTTRIIHDPAVTKEFFELLWKQFNSDADTLMKSNKTDVAVHASEGSLAQVSGAFNVPPGGTTHLARNPAVLTKKSSESSREQFKSDADPLMKSYGTDVAASTSVGSSARDFEALNEPFGGTTHITHDPAVLTQESSESSWEQFLNFAQENPTNQNADETSDIDTGKGLL